MECVQCGLAPCDLPDGVDAELIFEVCECCGQRFCQGCLFEHEAVVA